MNPLQYAVIGTGAVGGFYGALLHQAGQEVHFLLHRDYAWVHENGLILETKGQNLHFRVSAYQTISAMPQCDVVLVALKTTQNHLLPQLLPPLLKPDGVVVLLQNGLGMEEYVAQFLKTDRIIGGICFLCSHKVGPGHIRHLDQGRLTLGSLNPQNLWLQTRLLHIAEDLKNSGVPMVIAPDLILARWQKLLWNIPFNGLSVVLNADTQQMTQDPAIRSLIEDLMYEVLGLAKACGHAINPAEIEGLITASMVPYRTSMKLDYEASRPLELESMFAQPLNRGKQHGHTAPRTEMLYQQLQFLEAQYARSGSKALG